ncbi:hypothetical protein ACOME3_009454 [Neoechinorhynchus agilis]
MIFYSTGKNELNVFQRRTLTLHGKDNIIYATETVNPALKMALSRYYAFRKALKRGSELTHYTLTLRPTFKVTPDADKLSDTRVSLFVKLIDARNNVKSETV